MGTGILSVALYLGRNRIPFFSVLAFIFSIITIILLAVVSLIWFMKLILHYRIFVEELHHPVSGSFVPTYPISFMIAAVDILLLGQEYFGFLNYLQLAGIFFWIGTIGIYFLSWIIMPALFRSNQVEQDHGTFGWYIPPVSHLIVPVVGLDLVHRLQGGFGSELYFAISLISLGIGFFLFMFIGPNVFYRYIYRASPTGKMAPTILIGLAPTSILTIIIVKFHNAVPLDSVLFSIEPNLGMSQVFGIILWGFSFWWFILSTIKILYAYSKGHLNFALSWWAFTFPIGAFSVSTGALNNLIQTGFLSISQLILTIILLLIWTYVTVRTTIGVINGSIFME